MRNNIPAAEFGKRDFRSEKKEADEIDFICTEKVTGIKLDKGWCYVSCSNSTKKLQRTVSAFTCLDCNNTNAVGVLKTDVCSICSHRIGWRCPISIADETAEGLFVCFDGVMTKLHNMRRAYEAGHLLAGDGVNPEDTQAPPFVADMEVKVTGDRMPLPQFVDNGGDDDNGDDNSGAISVRAKVETGGSSQVQGSSGIKKKARKA
ncbi:hypothetical protein YC2023_060117 [Brassica napus]